MRARVGYSVRENTTPFASRSSTSLSERPSTPTRMSLVCSPYRGGLARFLTSRCAVVSKATWRSPQDFPVFESLATSALARESRKTLSIELTPAAGTFDRFKRSMNPSRLVSFTTAFRRRVKHSPRFATRATFVRKRSSPASSSISNTWHKFANSLSFPTANTTCPPSPQVNTDPYGHMDG